MIIRIVGQGQYDIPDNALDEFNLLDARLQTTVDSGDMEAYRHALRVLLATVVRFGHPVPDTVLTASELVLPSEDTDLERVREMLGDEGLIPG
jgi:hypothetical protein